MDQCLWPTSFDKNYIYFYINAHTLSFAKCAEHCQLAVLLLNFLSYWLMYPTYMHSWTCVLHNNCMLNNVHTQWSMTSYYQVQCKPIATGEAWPPCMIREPNNPQDAVQFSSHGQDRKCFNRGFQKRSMYHHSNGQSVTTACLMPPNKHPKLNIICIHYIKSGIALPLDHVYYTKVY